MPEDARSSSASRSTQRRGSNWAVPLTIVVIAILALAMAIYLHRGSSENGNSSATGDAGTTATRYPKANTEKPSSGFDPAQLRALEQRNPKDPFSAGPVDAPVGLLVFSDYQCQHCAQWTRDTLPAMLDYARQGKLRIEWRDVNLFGSPSRRAARAAYAAARQNHYWEYHDALFAGGKPRSAAQLGEPELIALATQQGLAPERFRADMNSDAAKSTVDLNERFAASLQVFSTPSFLLAGQPYSGGQPTDVFTAAIERALADQGAG